MQPFDPWLAQGDVFVDVPILATSLNASGEVDFTQRLGTAVLITQDCVLDKKTRSGVMKLERISFVEFRPMVELSPDHQRALLTGRVDPSEAFMGAAFGDLSDMYGLLSTTYHVPAAYFGGQLRDFQGDTSLVATANDRRVARLTDAERELLNYKQAAFWARLGDGRP